jgi:outer membrane protein OmpA-like peptidoglycan-associated protein
MAGAAESNISVSKSSVDVSRRETSVSADHISKRTIEALPDDKSTVHSGTAARASAYFPIAEGGLGASGPERSGSFSAMAGASNSIGEGTAKAGQLTDRSLSTNGQAMGGYSMNSEPGASRVVAQPTATFSTLPKPEDKVVEHKYLITDREKFNLKIQDFQEKLQIAQLALKTDIKYDFAKDKMDPKTREALGKVADAIKILDDLPGMENEKFTIHGHTDSKGDNTGFDNQALSEKRAGDLKAALVEMGVRPERLETQGHGSSEPLAANEKANGVDNPEGRAQNRRSELKFSMTAVEYEAYLTKIEAQLTSESKSLVTTRETIPGERATVNHLKPQLDQSSSAGGSGSAEYYENMRKQEELLAKPLALALGKLADQKTDLKLESYGSEKHNVNLRVDRNPEGGFQVSLYHPGSHEAIHTSLYSEKGIRFATKSDFPIIASSIENGIKSWYGAQN